MSHAIHDRVGIELARRVADRLEEHPERIECARGNLRRWLLRNADSPGLVRTYLEWQSILDRTPSEIRAVLLDESDEGQRLRQSSPFAGVVPPHEVWDIKRAVRENLLGDG